MSPIDDNDGLRIELSATFRRWLADLRDRKAKALIAARLLALEGGHWGDVKPVGGGVSELRLHFGPGYRLYATRRGRTWVVLLCGGDKDSQRRDIETAKAMAKDLEQGELGDAD